MNKHLFLSLLLLAGCQAAGAIESQQSSAQSQAPNQAPNQTNVEKPARIDYSGFVSLSDEAGAHRAKRLVDIDTFTRMSKEPQTIILDARSESAFKRKHFKNAVHLNFSDFSFAALERLIPDKNTRILIYCNNNIDGDEQNFARKSTPLALNIPTFINLYGYGYKNVYELSSLLNADDPKLEFEGTAVGGG